LSVRVTPASVKPKPVPEPPKFWLRTAIWSEICLAVRLPVDPSVTTWK